MIVALFVMGLASGIHCVGMCGGIVGAFSAPLLPARVLWRRQVAFNAGRITTYAAAGAAAGAAGFLLLPAQSALFVIAHLAVAATGLYLLGWTGIEKLGMPLWRTVQPHAVRLLQARTLPRSFAAGLAWGALPCGLLYGALAASAFAGGPAEGAAAMAAFGAGTAPWLLAAGALAARLRALVSTPPARRAAGVLLIGLGAWGLAHAAALPQWLCL